MSLNPCRILFCLLLSTCVGLAQDRGSIAGTLTDPSGANVPGATVTLKNPATGLSQTFVSRTDGGFSFQSLPAGEYGLTIEKPGFRKAELTAVRVAVNTSTRADVTMTVGQVQETVEVAAAAPLLQTDRSDLGKVIDNRAIEALPLFASGGMRSNVAFATLTPGVTADLTIDPDTAAGAPRIAGGSSNSNTSLLVDGGESQSERRNDPQMRVVSVEGVQEFKVQTSAYSAEYGRTGNGFLNFATKSGTNEFHGTLFAQVRNQALNANGFFYIAPLPSAQTVHNQVLEAASLGGPVWIPKVFNGRNKAFFFFSGERSRAKDIASSSLISVPTAAARAGDFTGNLGSNGLPVPIYNPFDTAGNVLANANARVVFPGNKIPASMINPVAALALSYEPLPQNPNSFLQNNPVVNTGSRTPGERQGVYTIKGDLNPTDKLRFNGLFTRQYLNGCDVCLGPNPGPQGEGFQENYNNRYVHFNTDYVFKPTLLNHLSFNYNQRNGAEAPNIRLGDNVTGPYGIGTRLPGVPTYTQSPLYTSFKLGTFGNFNTDKSDTLLGGTWNLKESITWLKGKHNIKAGFEYMRQNYNGNFCNVCGGAVTFSAAATGNPSVSGTTGVDLASFLLGVGTASFSFPSNANFVYPYYAAFIQDDFKVNRKLTINIGLRYDLPLPKREAHGWNSQFDPNVPNPGAGNLLGALSFAGSGPGRTGRATLLEGRRLAFGPRLGFAYQLSSKTVIRAGGGIIYGSNKEDGAALDSISGFGGTYSAPANNYSTGINVVLPDGKNNAIAGLLPYADPITKATPPRVDPTITNFSNPGGYYSDGKVAQNYDFNFTIERTFTQSLLARVSFHANYGNQVQSSQNYNQLDPRYIPIYGNLLTQPLSSLVSATGVPTNSVLIASGYRLPYATYPLTQTLGSSLDPYPQYSQGFSGTTNGGHSTYNALESQLQHSFANGVFFQASYTFSKWMADNTSPNVYAKNREKDLSGSDRRHVFALSYIYDIPLGKGQKFGSTMNPVADALFGGWRIGAVQRYQSGTPVGVSCGQNLFGAGVARCDYVVGQSLYNPNWDPTNPNSPYLNKSAFIQPANGVFGSTGAIIPGIRSPIQLGEDLALSKTFKIASEKRTLEFRGSAFNVANRHYLAGLGTNTTASTYGLFSNPQANLARNVEFSLRFKF